MVVVASVTGLGRTLADALSPWLPIDPTSIDAGDAITLVVALTALAIGVRRRKRLALPMAMFLFLAAAITQALVLHHPIAAALAIACLGALVRDAHRFRTRTGRRTRRIAIGVLLLAIGALLTGSALENLATGASAISPATIVIGTIIDVLALGDVGGAVAREPYLLALVEVLAEAAIVIATVAVLAADPDRPPAEDLIRDRVTAARHVVGSLAPFQVGADKLFFAEPGMPGVVAYGLAGRHAIVVGDPIGPSGAAWTAFEDFERQCRDGDVEVAVYQASASGAGRLADLGYRTFRVGSEAVLDLQSFDLAGSRRANLRHSVARAERAGVEVRWHPMGLDSISRALWADEMTEIDREWQGGRSRMMQFTIGTFRPSDLSDVAVAVALESTGRIGAFVTFRETGSGAWVMDLTRRRTECTPGALEACLARAALAMRAAGDRELSLGLVAMVGMTPARGVLEERLQAVGARIVATYYDIGGLHFFKNKFNPRWVPRYGAVRGRSGFIGFAMALWRLHLGIGIARPASTAGESSAGRLTSVTPHASLEP